MARGTWLILLLAAIVAAPASAGGDSFACRVVGFDVEAKDEYVIALETLETNSWGGRIVVHARYREPWNLWWRKLIHTDHPLVTPEHHHEALSMLRRTFESHQPTRFGVMGSGLKPIVGRIGHYHSDALIPLEEPGPNGGVVVYSFHDW